MRVDIIMNKDALLKIKEKFWKEVGWKVKTLKGNSYLTLQPAPSVFSFI